MVTGFLSIIVVTGSSSGSISSIPSIGTSSSISWTFPFFLIIILLITFALGSLPYLIFLMTNSSPGISSSTSLSLLYLVIVLILINLPWVFLNVPVFIVLYITFLPGSSSASSSLPSLLRIIFFLIIFVLGSSLSPYLIGSNITSSLFIDSSNPSTSLPFLIVFLFLTTFVSGLLLLPYCTILYIISSISGSGCFSTFFLSIVGWGFSSIFLPISSIGTSSSVSSFLPSLVIIVFLVTFVGSPSFLSLIVL